MSELFKILISPYKIDSNKIIGTGEYSQGLVIVDGEYYTMMAFGIFENLKEK